MLACQILRRLKMYDNLANFDKETEKVCKIWPILRRRLNEYENLSTFDKCIEKV